MSIRCELCRERLSVIGSPHPAATCFRTVAADWHAGQSSALYAFASTGTILPGLTGEIRQALAEVKSHPGLYTDADRRSLRALDEYVGV